MARMSKYCLSNGMVNVSISHKIEPVSRVQAGNTDLGMGGINTPAGYGGRASRVFPICCTLCRCVRRWRVRVLPVLDTFIEEYMQ